MDFDPFEPLNIDPMEPIREAAWRAVEYQHSIIERACERALAGGEHGVLVLRMGHILLSAEPDPSVPYGQIHDRQI